MICDTCGNTAAYRMDKVGNDPWSCDRCGHLGAMAVPDVYFRRAGEKYENLADGFGRPVEFASRGDKAAFMRSNGVREAGDRIHGARTLSGSTLPTQSAESRKAEVRSAVRDAKRRLGFR